MARQLKTTTIMLAVLLAAASNTLAKDLLNYRSPAKEWMEALPMGNGRIGAMVYGETVKETIALSELTMWSGQPDPDANNLCGRENLDKMRAAFFRGDIAEGNRLGQMYLNGHCRSFGTNLPFGDIRISFKGRNGTAENYLRSLSLDDGTSKISYSIYDVKYSNEYFCSNPAQVFVARYSASGKKNVSASVSLALLRHGTVTASGNQIEAKGDARFSKNGAGGVGYRSIVRIIPDGGQLRCVGDTAIEIIGANSFVLIADIRTDYQSPKYDELCAETVSDAVQKGYKNLLQKHTSDFNRLYSRMNICLGGDANINETADEMFKHAKEGTANPRFDALFFQYGRYMLISSSRENSPLPAHLQGVWNDNLACNMPWTCDYHLDINIQQNYWSANIANLAECNTPLFRYIEMLSRYGHETAKKMYGCDGWVAHTINNVWGATMPGDGLGWSMNVTAGAWLATHLWTHYDFTRDDAYLHDIGYPLLKKTAEFFVDYMAEDPSNGYLVTGPSISPENAFRMPDGNCYNLSMMPTMDRAVVYDIYQACVKSSEILNTDADFRSRLERDLKRLPPLQIGDDGALKEWLPDGATRADPAHRHAAHLVTLYPFGQISPTHTPELAQSCERFLELQTSNANWEDNEWSRGNMINFYARLKNSAEAYKSLLALYKGFMRENLMTVSPAGIAGAESDIFSFDATEAAVAGMCEMILQSYDGCLDFLPALPQEWHDGSVKGICARGGIVADVEWRDGRLTRATLRSTSNQTVECRYNGTKRTIDLKAGKSVCLL